MSDDLADALLRKKFLAGGDLRGPELVRPGADLSGQPFGRFRVLRDLGEGGLGRVLLAEDPQTGQKVALKLLKRALPEDLARFEREAAVARSLSHPNILPVLDYGREGEQPWLATPYVEGRTLAEVDCDLARKLEIAVKIARALGHAHAKGVMHRDVKPENILVDRGGEPVIADFGLARLAGGTRITAEGVVAGTPHFMSPEQVDGRGAEAGPAADVWGLGATLYRFFTGAVPFDGRTPAEIFERIRTAEPARPKGVPRAAAEVLLRALAKDPTARFADGVEMAKALDMARLSETPRARGCLLGWFR